MLPRDRQPAGTVSSAAEDRSTAKAHELTDSFNDNSIDTGKWVAYGDPAPVSQRVLEVNGRIEIRPRSGDSNKSGS
jgi:hypothetical protein